MLVQRETVGSIEEAEGMGVGEAYLAMFTWMSETERYARRIVAFVGIYTKDGIDQAVRSCYCRCCITRVPLYYTAPLER